MKYYCRNTIFLYYGIKKGTKLLIMEQKNEIQVSKMVTISKSKNGRTCCDDSMGECDHDY